MSYLQIKKINLETFFLLILIFTTAGLGAAWEINVGSASLNIETLLLLALGLYLIVKKSFFLDTFKNSNVIIIFSVIFLLLFLIVDFLIRKNNGAFYELSFLILLSSYPLSIYLHSRSKLAAHSPIWIIFILISLNIIFLPNKGGAFDEWDLVTLEGSGILNRLSILGYVSNALAIILLFHIVYCFEGLRKLHLVSIFSIFLCIYWISQTFSRIGILILVILLIWEFWSLTKKSFILRILFISFLSFIAIYQLSNILAALDLIFGTGRTNIFVNPRFSKWLSLMNQLQDNGIFGYLFGIGFFQMPSDNTFIGIFAGKGIIGLFLYLIVFIYGILSIFFTKFDRHKKRKILQIIFILFSSAFTMDYFGQRKIIIISAVYIAALIKKNNEILHPRRL